MLPRPFRGERPGPGMPPGTILRRAPVRLHRLLPWLVAAGMACQGETPGPTTAPPDIDPLPGDEELVTPEIPGAPVESPAWTEWIRQNHVVIRSLTSSNFTDLRALRPYLESRQIVALGESGHGVAEFNSAKVRLVRFLHEEMGFDVIAFESGFFECVSSNLRADSLAPEELMARSIFAVWRCEETLPLFAYIQETRKTDRPLHLAGLDIQPSGGGSADRPSFLQEVVSHLDAGYGRRVRSMDSTLVAEMGRGWTSFQQYASREEAALTSGYDSLYSFLTSHEAELRPGYPGQEILPTVAAQTAWCSRKLIQMVLAVDEDPWEIRDAAMYTNLGVLQGRIYPGSRLILWAHNAHVRRLNATVMLRFGMGDLIARYWADRYYVIGLYMLRGRAAFNDRTVYEIGPIQDRSLESIVYQARRKYVFVDVRGQPAVAGNSWMTDENVTAREWGLYDVPMELRSQYDGLLVIDTVRPPAYLAKSGAEPPGSAPTDRW